MSDVNTIEIDIAGDVVERQTLLSGMQIVTLEGASADGVWTLSGSCSWNPRLGSDASEGDLTLSRNDGAELFASLAAGTVVEPASDAEAGFRVNLEFGVDGGAGEFDAASGSVQTTGGISREVFSLYLRITISGGPHSLKADS